MRRSLVSILICANYEDSSMFQLKMMGLTSVHSTRMLSWRKCIANEGSCEHASQQQSPEGIHVSPQNSSAIGTENGSSQGRTKKATLTRAAVFPQALAYVKSKPCLLVWMLLSDNQDILASHVTIKTRFLSRKRSRSHSSCDQRISSKCSNTRDKTSSGCCLNL
jgi:hypothetical protein